MIGEISVRASPRNPAENLWADCEAKPGHGFVQFARVQKATPPVPVQCATSNRYIKLAVPKKTMNGWMNYLKLCKLSELWNCNCFLSVCVCLVDVQRFHQKTISANFPHQRSRRAAVGTSGPGFACPSRIFERPPSASWFRARRSPGWFGWWSHFQKLVSLYPKRDDLGCLKTSPPGCFNSIHHQNFWSPNI